MRSKCWGFTYSLAFVQRQINVSTSIQIWCHWYHECSLCANRSSLNNTVYHREEKNYKVHVIKTVYCIVLSNLFKIMNTCFWMVYYQVSWSMINCWQHYQSWLEIQVKHYWRNETCLFVLALTSLKVDFSHYKHIVSHAQSVDFTVAEAVFSNSTKWLYHTLENLPHIHWCEFELCFLC